MRSCHLNTDQFKPPTAAPALIVKHAQRADVTGHLKDQPAPGWKGANRSNALLLPEKKRWADWKGICKSVEQEENHEKGPRCPWARNQMGNPS